MFCSTWHCGNATSLAADPNLTALRSRSDSGRVRSLSVIRRELAQFQLMAGPVTFAGWPSMTASGRCLSRGGSSPATRRWRAPGYGSRGRSRSLPNADQELLRNASMSHGDQEAALRLACKFWTSRLWLWLDGCADIVGGAQHTMCWSPGRVSVMERARSWLALALMGWSCGHCHGGGSQARRAGGLRGRLAAIASPSQARVDG